MALITTSVSPEIRITPFTGLSETLRERSGIARAEVVYSSYDIWPATGAGDERGLILSWDLDPNYGYILMDCTAAFISSAANNAMDAVGFMEIGTDLGPGSSQKERQHYQLVSQPARQDTAGTSAVGNISANQWNTQYPAGTLVGMMTFGMPIKPTALLYPFPGVNNIEIAVAFGENAVQEASVAYRFYCRFLQYDITQGFNYVVNSPRLTR